jgi:hypothetical protein
VVADTFVPEIYKIVNPEPQSETKPTRVYAKCVTPAGLAALARFRPPMSDIRKCARCAQIAVRGSLVCRHHGGCAKAARKPTAEQLAARPYWTAMSREIRCGTVPAGLLAHPVWALILTQKRFRLLGPALIAAWRAGPEVFPGEARRIADLVLSNVPRVSAEDWTPRV